ncbi:MAG: YceD family protein [Flavobacteriaceae bacterium]
MKPLKAYDIQFVGLKLGKHIYDYEINQTFFEYFEFDEFNTINVNLNIHLEKKTTLLELNFSGNGSVNINCDVSNEPYDQPINFNFNLVVKFGQEYNNENDSILIIPHGSYEINIAQYIYELIVLSIPQKRIHPGVEDGTLNSEILRKLEDLSPNTDLKAESSSNDVDPRWNKLKKLLTDKE